MSFGLHPRTLEEIWKFAKSQEVGKIGPHLADLLEMFTSFMDEKSSVEILNKMGEAPAEVGSYSYYHYETQKAGPGCSTKKRRKAILAAVCAFKWDAGMFVHIDFLEISMKVSLQESCYLLYL